MILSDQTAASRRPGWPPAGYTLVEILVVLAIIAIGSSIALYSYASYRDSLSIDSSAQIVQRMLMQARGRAIHLNAPHEVVIDLDRDILWIDQLNASQTDRTPKVVRETPLAEFVVIDELRIGSQLYTEGTQSILFEQDGRAPLVIMTLRRDYDDSAEEENYTSIRLYPASGEAQILSGEKLL